MCTRPVDGLAVMAGQIMSLLTLMAICGGSFGQSHEKEASLFRKANPDWEGLFKKSDEIKKKIADDKAKKKLSEGKAGDCP